jgi:hypothetical protein
MFKPHNEDRDLSEQPAQEDEPKQKTEKGLEIPVPKRKDFFGSLEKVSKPDLTA